LESDSSQCRFVKLSASQTIDPNFNVALVERARHIHQLLFRAALDQLAGYEGDTQALAPVSHDLALQAG
jgi:hypothetical protein